MPKVQFLDRVVDMPVAIQRLVPMIPVHKTVEVPQILEAPVVVAHHPVPVDVEVSLYSQCSGRFRPDADCLQEADALHGDRVC